LRCVFIFNALKVKNLKYSQLIITVFFCSCTVSCIYQHATGTTATEQSKEITAQDKAEEAINEYVITHYNEVGSYTGYSFGQLYSLKPKAIVELDQLIETRKKLPEMKAHYKNALDSVITATDTLIVLKKREIRENKIYHTYEVNHLFTIKPPKEALRLYEFTFYLYPNFKIKDVKMELKTTLTPEEKSLFEYFIERFPLVTDDDQYFENDKNKRMYTALSNSLLNAKENKEEIIHQILAIVKHIRQHNEFKPDLFCAQLIKNWVKDHEYGANYRPIIFTRIKENKNNPNHKMMYHKLQYQPASSQMKEIALSFEFDENYLPVEIIEYTDQYEQYFE